MSGWVSLARFEGKKLHLTKRDRSFQNGVGYLVTKHWSAWAWYLIVLALWTTAAFASLAVLGTVGALQPLPDTFTLALLIVVSVGVSLLAWVRYRVLALNFILLTPATIFHSEVQNWTEQVVDVLGVEAVSALDTDEQHLLLPGVRVVQINTAGDMADKTMTFCAGRDAITAAWQILRERRRR